MQMPNPVPPIQQQIQRFSKPQVQPSAEQQVHELALEIYARAAADCLDGADDDRLRRLATESQQAAKVYFESRGVKFND